MLYFDWKKFEKKGKKPFFFGFCTKNRPYI